MLRSSITYRNARHEEPAGETCSENKVTVERQKVGSDAVTTAGDRGIELEELEERTATIPAARRRPPAKN